MAELKHHTYRLWLKMTHPKFRHVTLILMTHWFLNMNGGRFSPPEYITIFFQQARLPGCSDWVMFPVAEPS